MIYSTKNPIYPSKTSRVDESTGPELLEIIERARASKNDRLLRLPQVAAKIGRASSTIWKDVKEKTLPCPVSVGPRSVAWRESELQAWIEVQVFASRSKRKIDMKAFIALLTAM
jgi:prophage regulatory protein